MQLRPPGRGGPRDHGRERVGQEHARQDADRRPPSRSRVDRGRGQDALGDPLPAGGARARDRRGLPGGPRRPAALDPRQPLARHRPAAPGRSLEIGAARARVRDAARAHRHRSRPRTSGRGALAQRSPGLLHRARSHPPTADPRPRRGNLGARRRDARPAVLDRATPRGRGDEHDLHLPPDGRGGGDRRPGHGDAGRRDRRDACPWGGLGRRARPPDDRRRAPDRHRARPSRAPSLGGRRPACVRAQAASGRRGDRLRAARRRDRRPRGPRRPGPGRVPARPARCRRRRRQRRPRDGGARGRDRLAACRCSSRDRVRAARAPRRGALRRPLRAGELHAADGRARHGRGLRAIGVERAAADGDTSTGCGSSSAGRATASGRSRAGTSRRW